MIDWAPDNSLVFVSGQSLYRTLPNSLQSTRLVEFPEHAGFPDHLAISPDGKRLAFSLVTHRRPYQSAVWVLDLDGSRLVQMAVTIPGPRMTADSEDISDQEIRYPTWSPDGEHILVIEGGNPLIHGFVVPADGEKVPLTFDAPTQAIPINSFFGHDVEGYEAEEPYWK